MLRWRRALITLSLVILFPAFGPASADIEKLTLYQKTGRAPLVVLGEVVEGKNRLAVIRVTEIVKCEISECPGDQLRIAFRLDSFLRKPWEDKIGFEQGEQVVLFLRKFTKEDGKSEGDIYTLMWGAEGKHILPPEGAAAYMEAVHVFEEILEIEDAFEQEDRIQEAIRHENPLVVETALEESIKLALGETDMIPMLVEFFERPDDRQRVLAMRLLRQILEDAAIAGITIPRRDDLADRVRGRASLDPSVDFRVQSVIVLSLLGGDQERALVERLAKEDGSQMVRYEAQKALATWR